MKTIQKLARLLAQTDERELTFRFERAEGEENSAMTVAPWPVQNPETEELKRRTDALEKRAGALEKEIVLLVWAIAAAAAAVAAVLLVCM